MARVIFRALIGITIVVMALGRASGGSLPAPFFQAFFSWFVASIAVFGAYGLYSAWQAWRDPFNRRAWLFDVLIAAAWVPYWFVNVRR